MIIGDDTMIQTEDDLQAFMVQDTSDGCAFAYLYDPNTEAVVLFVVHPIRKVIEVVQKNFPFGCTTPFDYFKELWQKSLLFNMNNIAFVGWCDPKTFELI